VKFCTEINHKRTYLLCMNYFVRYEHCAYGYDVWQGHYTGCRY